MRFRLDHLRAMFGSVASHKFFFVLGKSQVLAKSSSSDWTMIRAFPSMNSTCTERSTSISYAVAAKRTFVANEYTRYVFFEIIAKAKNNCVFFGILPSRDFTCFCSVLLCRAHLLSGHWIEPLLRPRAALSCTINLPEFDPVNCS